MITIALLIILLNQRAWQPTGSRMVRKKIAAFAGLGIRLELWDGPLKPRDTYIYGDPGCFYIIFIFLRDTQGDVM